MVLIVDANPLELYNGSFINNLTHYELNILYKKRLIDYSYKKMVLEYLNQHQDHYSHRINTILENLDKYPNYIRDHYIKYTLSYAKEYVKKSNDYRDTYQQLLRKTY